MRIALFSDWYLPRRGGIELHLADLAARLAAAGHAVDVLTTTPASDGPPADEAPGDDVRAIDGPPMPGRVRVQRLDVPRLPGAGIAFSPALGRAVEEALAAGAYDVVHAHASVVAPVAGVAVHAARRRAIPCVLTFHSMLGLTARALGAAELLAGWAQGDVLVTGVSTIVAASLRRALPHARVAVLPNATDVAWWRDGAGREDAAASLVPRRAPGELRLVTAMRLVPKKRPLALPRLLAAACAAAPAGTSVRLVVAGEGSSRAAMERAAARRGVDHALVRVGWQPRPVLRALYRDADAFVLPTRHESFGIAALEARAAGLPVLGMAGTGLVDFVHDGADGVLCADDASLGRVAARLATDAGWRAALRARSAACPPHAFDWAAVLARHEAAYAGDAGGGTQDAGHDEA